MNLVGELVPRQVRAGPHLLERGIGRVGEDHRVAVPCDGAAVDIADGEDLAAPAAASQASSTTSASAPSSSASAARKAPPGWLAGAWYRDRSGDSAGAIHLDFEHWIPAGDALFGVAVVSSSVMLSMDHCPAP